MPGFLGGDPGNPQTAFPQISSVVSPNRGWEEGVLEKCPCHGCGAGGVTVNKVPGGDVFVWAGVLGCAEDGEEFGRGRLLLLLLGDDDGRWMLLLFWELASTCVFSALIFSSMYLSKLDCLCFMVRISLCVAFVWWNMR